MARFEPKCMVRLGSSHHKARGESEWFLMPRKKKQNRKRGVCTFCLKRRLLSEDHVPPKCLFHKADRKALIKVPACDMCNMSASKDDEWLRLVLSFSRDATREPHVSRVLPTVMRSLKRPEARGFSNAFFSSVRNVDVWSGGGVFLYQARGFDIDQARLERIISKIVRGLFFRELKRRLPLSYVVLTCYLNTLPFRSPHAEATEFIRSCGVMMGDSQPKRIANGAFVYRYNTGPDNAFETIWAMLFYTRLEFVAFTVSKKMIAQHLHAGT